MTGAIIGSDHLIFRGGGGGGGKITLVLDFFLRALEPGYLCFVWYGPGFLSARIMHIIKTKMFIIQQR